MVVFYIHLLFIAQNFAHWSFVNLSKFRIKCIGLQENKDYVSRIWWLWPSKINYTGTKQYPVTLTRCPAPYCGFNTAEQNVDFSDFYISELKVKFKYFSKQRWASTLASRTNDRHQSKPWPLMERSEISYFFENPKAKIVPSTAIVVNRCRSRCLGIIFCTFNVKKHCAFYPYLPKGLR